MIDRERVRSLARRKHPRMKLLEFLSRAEPIAAAMDAAVAEMQANVPADPGYVVALLARFLADSRVRVAGVLPDGSAIDLTDIHASDLVALLDHLVDIAAEISTHGEIMLMRFRTRGKISPGRTILGRRLDRVQSSFSAFVPLFAHMRVAVTPDASGHSGPNQIMPPL